MCVSTLGLLDGKGSCGVLFCFYKTRRFLVCIYLEYRFHIFPFTGPTGIFKRLVLIFS